MTADDPTADRVIGIDIGGTHVKGVVCTPAGVLLARDSEPTGDDGTPAWRDSVGRLVRRLSTAHGTERVGIAAPGLATRAGDAIGYMPGRLTGLEGCVWSDVLAWPRPIPVLNDAHAALLGEVWCGAAKGTRDAVLVTLGTGVGGAVWADGRLLKGALGRAGHLGHVTVDASGAPDIVNTPGSLEDALGECSLARRTGGRFTTTAELLVAATSGDAGAAAVWRASVRALAAALAGFINVLDPEVIVLGGGVSAAGPALLEPLAEDLARFEWRPGGHAVPVVSARLGNDAGALGAARAALEGVR